MASMAMPPYKASAFNMMVKGVSDSCRVKKPEADLSGKTLLITGSNSGIGLACAKIVPNYGVAHIIMAVRSIPKGEEAAASFRHAYPNCNVEVWELDMLSYPSIEAFAERCNSLPRLDIAILNAGLGSGNVSRINSSTGHEETIQVNYISTTLLSALLLPILAVPSPTNPSEPGRLTIVGSGTAYFANFPNRTADPLLPSFDIPFSGLSNASERYSVSKLLVCILTHKLSQYVSADKVIINTVEPGLTSGTSLHRDFTGPGKYIMASMKKVSAKSPEEAAWTYIDAAAVHGKESHGGMVMFWEVCG